MNEPILKLVLNLTNVKFAEIWCVKTALFTVKILTVVFAVKTAQTNNYSERRFLIWDLLKQV